MKKPKFNIGDEVRFKDSDIRSYRISGISYREDDDQYYYQTCFNGQLFPETAFGRQIHFLENVKAIFPAGHRNTVNIEVTDEQYDKLIVKFAGRKLNIKIEEI